MIDYVAMVAHARDHHRIERCRIRIRLRRKVQPDRLVRDPVLDEQRRQRDGARLPLDVDAQRERALTPHLADAQSIRQVTRAEPEEDELHLVRPEELVERAGRAPRGGASADLLCSRLRNRC